MRGGAPEAGLGRNAALTRLNEIMRAVRSGAPRLVLVHHHPSAEQSTLVEDWLDASSPLPVVFKARCGAAATDQAFATLNRLLTGMPHKYVEGLPLLRALSPESDPVQVSEQLHRLADKLGATGPVVLVVDDAQWIDVASMRALGLLVRSFTTSPVMTTLVLRAGKTRPALEEELLTLMREVEDATRLELRSPGHDRNLTGVPQEPARVSRAAAPGSLEMMVRQQLLGLSADARNLVEAVAVMDGRCPLDVLAAVGRVENPVGAVATLVKTGLVEWWPSDRTIPVAMRHSLQRGAVLAMITPARLRQLHEAAAVATCRDTSWRHRIAVRAAGPSERLAAEVEQAAITHRQDGRVNSASTLLLWASKMSENQQARERRLLTAAAYSMWIDDIAKVTALLPQVRDCAPSPLKDLVLGAHGVMSGTPGDMEGLLFRAMATADGVDGLEWVFMMAGSWLGMELVMSDCERSFPVLDRVLSGPVTDLWLTERAQALTGMAVGFCEGPRAGVHAMARTRPQHAEVPDRAFSTHLRTASGMLHVWDGELLAGRQELDAVGGALALACSSAASYLLGDWDSALDSGSRAVSAALAGQQSCAVSFSYAVASWVPSGRGEHEHAESLLHTAERALAGLSPGFLKFSLPVVALSWAVHSQAKGDHQGMLRALSTVTTLPEHSMKTAVAAWWLPMYVEALIGAGDLGAAAKALAELDDLSRRIRCLRLVRFWLAGLLCEAAGKIPEAVVTYRAGLEHVSGVQDVPLHRARLEHSLGRALDAAGEDSAAWLASASRRVRALNAAAFVRQFDLASAEPLGARHSTLPLRGREHTIALLVGRGLTNREIAGELFVSTKTIEYHLSNIYARLNLPNRRHLRDYVQQRTRVE